MGQDSVFTVTKHATDDNVEFILSDPSGKTIESNIKDSSVIQFEVMGDITPGDWT